MPNNMVLLETIALTQSAASVTFDNLPTSGYTDLKIVMSARTDSTSPNIFFSINGSTSTFTNRALYGDGASAASTNAVPRVVSYASISTNTASTFGNTEIYIPNYRSSNNKSYSVDTVSENNATTAYTGLFAGLWSTTSAITSLTFTPDSGNFVAGSTFSLYGIAALGTTPVLAPKATGGNIVANDGTYWYHAFTSSGNFVPQVGLSADYLVVAGGGGGGGYYHGAGGGAGGLRAITAQTLATGTNYAVTVGAGGVGGPINGGAGGNGSLSSFNSFATSGGGGGGSTRGDLAGFTGKAGGSGGGAPSYNASMFGAGNTGSYSPVEGYAGGNAATGAPYYGSGGGGGASRAGWGGTNSAGGYGADGVDTYNSINFSTWLTATGTGSAGKLAGGGGGSAYDVGAFGVGGAGGGGRGANQVGGSDNPVAGTANTGGGGGGSERSGAGVGAAGGSGIVIIRYPIA